MILHLVTQVGTERFAFPAESVVEAVDQPGIEWVPGVPDGMLGQLMHRGRMIGAWDADRVFHLGGHAGGGAAVILRDGDARLAVVVDDVTEMIRVEAAAVLAVPAGSDPDGVLAGVCLRGAGAGKSLVNLVRVDALTALMLRRETLVHGAAR